MRRKLIAGNWKMNTTISEAVNLAADIKKIFGSRVIKSEILVCPPFTNLYSVSDVLTGSVIKLGAQNCDFHISGAYTGEISINMIKAAGCTYVIIGHSERRTLYGETDEMVNLKVKSALEGGITPIICIGETLDERNAGNTFSVLERQISQAYSGIETDNLNKLVIAYEPVWAIGTGISATTAQAGEAHLRIRQYLRDNYGESASDIRILYGGSMNEKNSSELLTLPDVDGGLIGGASLKPELFAAIIEASENLSDL